MNDWFKNEKYIQYLQHGNGTPLNMYGVIIRLQIKEQLYT